MADVSFSLVPTHVGVNTPLEIHLRRHEVDLLSPSHPILTNLQFCPKLSVCHIVCRRIVPKSSSRRVKVTIDILVPRIGPTCVETIDTNGLHTGTTLLVRTFCFPLTFFLTFLDHGFVQGDSLTDGLEDNGVA